jgi:hypothetical protein
MDDHPIIPASQSQPEVPPEDSTEGFDRAQPRASAEASSRGLVEGDFGAILGRNREKSSFDRLRMILRYGRFSDL